MPAPVVKRKLGHCCQKNKVLSGVNEHRVVTHRSPGKSDVVDVLRHAAGLPGLSGKPDDKYPALDLTLDSSSERLPHNLTVSCRGGCLGNMACWECF